MKPITENIKNQNYQHKKKINQNLEKLATMRKPTTHNQQKSEHPQPAKVVTQNNVSANSRRGERTNPCFLRRRETDQPQGQKLELAQRA